MVSARILVAAIDFSTRMYSFTGGQPSSPGPKVMAAKPRSENRMCR